MLRATRAWLATYLQLPEIENFMNFVSCQTKPLEPTRNIVPFLSGLEPAARTLYYIILLFYFCYFVITIPQVVYHFVNSRRRTVKEWSLFPFSVFGARSSSEAGIWQNCRLVVPWCSLIWNDVWIGKYICLIDVFSIQSGKSITAQSCDWLIKTVAVGKAPESAFQQVGRGLFLTDRSLAEFVAWYFKPIAQRCDVNQPKAKLF